MLADDALSVLIDAFPLDGTVLDVDENLLYEFGGDFEFTVGMVGTDTLRFAAAIDDLLPAALTRLRKRLLTANVTGVETGFGRMAPDPAGTGLVALVDMVDLTAMTEDALKMRIVDFMLFAEYWRSEAGPELVAEGAEQDASTRMAAEGGLIRA